MKTLHEAKDQRSLLERLRTYEEGTGVHHTICDEAADEIERLLRVVAGLREPRVLLREGDALRIDID